MERWERELQRLRGLTLSGRARARVDRGPEGDGMPPAPARGQRVLAGVVAFAVFGGAVALAAGAFGGDDAPPLGTDPEPVVLTLVAGPNAPRMALGYGGAMAGLREEGGCWTQANGADGCSDAFGDHEPFLEDEFLRVPEGAPFEMVNPDQADPVHLFLEPGGGLDPEPSPEVRLEDLSIQPPGRYGLRVAATWDGRGSGTVYFALEIIEQEPLAGALVASLVAPTDGSMPDLRLTYGDGSEDFFAQGGEWPGVTGFDEPLLHFTPLLAGQTELRIDGDVDDVQASVERVDEQGRLTGEKTPLDLTDGTAALPSGGAYQLEIWGTWPEGSAGYFVRIRIGEQVTPPPDPATDDLVATLDAPDDGARPSITFSYGGVEQDYVACGGRWNGEQGVCVAMLIWFEAAIGSGTRLVIDGDAEEVTGETALMWPEGGLADPVPLDLADGSTELPTEDGSYFLSLQGRWPDGTGGLSVAITIGDPPVYEEPPLPSVEPGVVPDLVGLGEGDAVKVLEGAGFAAEIEYRSSVAVAPGTVIAVDPPPGSEVGPGSTVRLLVAGASIPLDGYLTVLSCPVSEMRAFDVPWVDVITASAEDLIRIHVLGVRDDDVLDRVASLDGGSTYVFDLRRDGVVIAVIATQDTRDSGRALDDGRHDAISVAACAGSELADGSGRG